MHHLVFWALLGVVALSPLPLGSNRPLGWNLMAIAVGLLLVLWATAMLLDRRRLAIAGRRSLPMALLFLGVMLWLAVQSLLPVPVMLQAPSWAAAGQALGTPLQGAIGLQPDRAIDYLIRLSTYAGVFWLALYLGRRPSRARAALWCVVGATAAYATYGLVVYVAGNLSIAWYDKWVYRDSLTSTFVNRNSFATYAALGLVVAAALLQEKLADGLPRGLPRRVALVRFIDDLDGGFWLSVFTLIVCSGALLLSTSRGGALSALFGLLVLTFAWRGSRSGPAGHRRGRNLLFAGLVWGGAIVMLLGAGDLLIGRLDGVSAQQSEHSQRLLALEVGSRAVEDRPLAGFGLGSFPDVFMHYRDPSFGTGIGSLRRAHNSYLELAIEAGVPAALLLLTALGIAVWRCLAGLFERHEDIVYSVAALAGTTVVAVHSLVDFSLQIPAITMTWCLLLGVGMAQSWRHRASSRVSYTVAGEPIVDFAGHTQHGGQATVIDLPRASGPVERRFEAR
ncbi:O-Antigen ligase [Tistlia consotensis]|uniref:O-Antigen ligase n=1 Tax=Tistlia consotensis USBA 355 TaxID=560819 RepID=A0A1Y6CMR7_9PROT|nr:O-antigen ligase family protein [Tistlia consotensis]SMF63070.1 O-Antigen ligase [Tistlia consotensis USBA 355]SNR95485.1 O-Antigen ligase [Tistlia consotensis]